MGSINACLAGHPAYHRVRADADDLMTRSSPRVQSAFHVGEDVPPRRACDLRSGHENDVGTSIDPGSMRTQSLSHQPPGAVPDHSRAHAPTAHERGPRTVFAGRYVQYHPALVKAFASFEHATDLLARA